MNPVPGFLASEIDSQKPENSFFHVIPIPMEHSVSYGSGTGKGPDAILHASQQLEAWDGQSFPLQMGIHTTAPVDCSADTGAVLERITGAAGKAISAGALPVGLGGEHSLTLGLLRALKQTGPFGIVQFDAHADLRDAYEDNRFSHACVMRRAVEELDLPLFQIGTRALCHEEHLYRTKAGIGFLDARTVHEGGVPRNPLPGDFPEKIYISFDVDGLDPSVIRATGTPVPGGLGWYQSIQLLERCTKNRTTIGFDVVELSPSPLDHASDFTAAQLVYSIMGIIQRGKSGTF
nr:agmatinase [uncultured Desulfobacter sp.]